MLFNMGLISALAANTPNSSAPSEPSGVDIQCGLGILHFYPNLGSPAPPDWQIPIFDPPVPATVSNDAWADSGEWVEYDPFQVPPSSTVEEDHLQIGLRQIPGNLNQSIPHSHSHPFGFAVD
jgi:hypothetical protein